MVHEIVSLITGSTNAPWNLSVLEIPLHKELAANCRARRNLYKAWGSNPDCCGIIVGWLVYHTLNWCVAVSVWY